MCFAGELSAHGVVDLLLVTLVVGLWDVGESRGGSVTFLFPAELASVGDGLHLAFPSSR